jgi:hypothetical protein
LEARLTIRGRLVPLRQALGYGVITCLLAAGIAVQLGIGLNNLRQLPESDPDIQAAQWIKAHSAPSTVIMARKEDLVYHYSQRRVIWFPPSSDARLLMEGIRKYHVQQVVVVDRENSYWKPSDADSFRALSEAYPNTFVPIYKGPHSKVFAVSS